MSQMKKKCYATYSRDSLGVKEGIGDGGGRARDGGNLPEV